MCVCVRTCAHVHLSLSSIYLFLSPCLHPFTHSLMDTFWLSCNAAVTQAYTYLFDKVLISFGFIPRVATARL